MDLLPPDVKRCCRCKLEKVVGENFYRSKSKGQRGWGGYCIPCVKIKAVEWQKANPAKKKASDHKQWLKPERQRKMRERLDRWAQENPERAREVARAGYERYKQRHPDRIVTIQARFAKSPKGRAAQKRWRASEKGKAAHREHERERRRTSVAHKIREVLRWSKRYYGRLPSGDVPALVRGWMAIVEAFGNACAFCGLAGDAMSLEIEHLTPRVVGGRDELANFAPSCRSCNATKHHRAAEDFAEYVVDVGRGPLRMHPAEIRRISAAVAARFA